MRLSKITRAISLFIVAAAITVSFSSCGSEGPSVMEYKDLTVTSNMYQYWMSGYKAMFLYTYSENMKDSASFWEEKLDDGVTTETFFTGIVDENIKKKLVAMSLFRESGLSLTNAVQTSVKGKVDQLVSDLSEGNKSKFNSFIADYGVNYDILFNIYLEEAKIEQLKDYLYGSYGAEKITDDQRDEYYKQNYTRIKHIFIRTEDRLVTDKDGNYVYDGEKYQTEALTEEEKQQKQAKIAQVSSKLDAGENFESLLTEYSEDEASSHYTNGFYFSASTEYIAEVLEAAFNMQIGEVRRVESEYGVHFVKKYELDDGAYSVSTNSDFFTTFNNDVTEYVFDQKLTALAADVKVNSEEKEKIKASVIPANWSF